MPCIFNKCVDAVLTKYYCKKSWENIYDIFSKFQLCLYPAREALSSFVFTKKVLAVDKE